MANQIADFGTRPDGATVQAITLSSDVLSATILTHGAVLQSLYLKGVDHSLTLGFPDLAPYLNWGAFFGCLIAPVANRIGKAQAAIDGNICQFDINENDNTLHSGSASSHTALWTLADHGDDFVTLTLRQSAGEGGFPGNRNLTATYRLVGDTLHLSITAQSDAPTLMNVAHHGYWNMDGAPTWAGHTLQIYADHVLPVTATTMPTGHLDDLTDHSFDFRQPRQISPGDVPHLDHNFCLAPARRDLAPALRLTGASGVTMELATTEPGLQIFDGGPINTGDIATMHGRPYGAHCAFAIEPQCWPDAPHHGHFPSIALDPGETYAQTSTYRFTR